MSESLKSVGLLRTFLEREATLSHHEMFNQPLCAADALSMSAAIVEVADQIAAERARLVAAIRMVAARDYASTRVALLVLAEELEK